MRSNPYRWLRLLLGMFVMTSVSWGADENKPFRAPTELRLTSGTILRKVEAIRFATDHVVVKYLGGVAPVQFRHIASLDADGIAAWREDLERKAAAKAESEAMKQRVAEASLVEYRGQAFITTKGAGNYKIGGMTVLVLPPEAEQAFSDTYGTVSLPAPITKCSTDADGRFSFKLPPGQAFLVFGQSMRIAGRYEEIYEWRVPSHKITDPGNIQLNSWNHHDKHSRIEFRQ